MDYNDLELSLSKLISHNLSRRQKILNLLSESLSYESNAFCFLKDICTINFSCGRRSGNTVTGLKVALQFSKSISYVSLNYSILNNSKKEFLSFFNDKKEYDLSDIKFLNGSSRSCLRGLRTPEILIIDPASMFSEKKINDLILDIPCSCVNFEKFLLIKLG